jgi:Tfp pilus assembly protein PilV
MSRPRPHSRILNRTRAGFSLVESMLALVLASGAMVAALGVIGASAKSEAFALRRAIGQTLATELLSEACSLSFEQPGWVGSFGVSGAEVGATARSTFNDVDDYNGWTESPPENSDGTSRADLDGWSRRVLVERVSLASHAGDAVAYDSRVKRVTVTVEWNGMEIATASAIRTSAWDDARRGTYTAAAPVGIQSDGVLVDVLDATGEAVETLGDVVGGIGGALGDLLGLN